MTESTYAELKVRVNSSNSWLKNTNEWIKNVPSYL